MTDFEECYKAMLKSRGIKSTKQRLAVLEVLCKSDALTAEEIFLNLRDSFLNLSLSTVYRILDTLSKNSVVTKSGLMEGGRALYEITPAAHRHNLICEKCHKITPLRDCPLAEYENEIEKITGYAISGHKLEVYGICPNCK